MSKISKAFFCGFLLGMYCAASIICLDVLMIPFSVMLAIVYWYNFVTTAVKE